MEKKWIIKSPIDSTTVEAFRSELKVSPVISELLLQRGITSFKEAKNFFQPKLEDLHDPFLMKNMEKAVNRLQNALISNEKILLFGDYDVDGTTAVALMHTFLKEHTIHLEYYIPDRYEEGYGLSEKGIRYAKENNFSLMILLDCGIKSVKLVEWGKELGIDFIICDHHEPGEIVPDAIVLDPKQSDCSYPYKELCGCGVGFKLLQALTQTNNWEKQHIYKLLDFVAIAIGADIVALTGENRILAHHGIRLLNEFTRTSFKKLLLAAKRSFPVVLEDIVFTIAPRINAAGRIYSGRKAVELMISEDEIQIAQLAQEIEQYNQERKKIESATTDRALEILEEDNWYHTSKSTIVYEKDWHKGVVGIVASKLIDKHFKPTIVLSEIGEKLTGSARSINNFDIYKAIDSCSDLLEQFGGHTHAAGLTLKKENFEAFRNKFDTIVRNLLTLEDETPVLIADLELHFNALFEKHENRTLIPKLKRILKQMEPHGPQNMKPVFYSSNVFSKSVRILKEEHLKLQVTQPDSDVVIDAIGFFMADKQLEVAEGVPFEMLYTLESNIWNGKESLQFVIKDVRAMV
ncbi:MAG: single-stranded-DNA-specific exonuclease RecJ [Crocinitomicaceae bacterium]|nr:single-stranded-DNA-specific exonuclease RecJ [Crocinitomicaceae bacterium]